jgi:hypothetical protein
MYWCPVQEIAALERIAGPYATGRVFHDADSHVMNFKEMMGVA